MQRQAWRVGALCLAISDQLQARFNPVTVRGELSGFARAASGHCYFTLKDEQGQLRAALFKRAAVRLAFAPQDGQQVEITGRLVVYEPRGELQLVAESMQQVGLGDLMERFLRLKSQLQAAGLFDAQRKRPIPAYPRCIGVVTSPDAAAWHDVMTTLARRVPHIPVVLAPARVQGAAAAQELVEALRSLYQQAQIEQAPIDVILLVRGGGSMEDLAAFHDEQLAYTLAQSPVPVICGVGHETDFSIADFVADVRAPTPTAAAELCAVPRLQALSDVASQADRLKKSAQQGLERRGQMLDGLTRRLLPPAAVIQSQRSHLQQLHQRWAASAQRRLEVARHGLAQAGGQLELLHPQSVLNRGFAWVLDEHQQVVKDASQLRPQQQLSLHLAKGTRDVVVQ